MDNSLRSKPIWGLCGCKGAPFRPLSWPETDVLSIEQNGLDVKGNIWKSKYEKTCQVWKT
jgi:hypothetical protein